MSEETPLLVISDDQVGGQSKKAVTFVKSVKQNPTKHERYQSSVTHLPKHIIESPREQRYGLSQPWDIPLIHPQTHSKQVPSKALDDEELPPTKLDKATLKQTPYIPSIQLCLLFSNVSLFTITLIFVIIMLVIQLSSISVSSITIGFAVLLIICSISGLFLSLSYNNVITKTLTLNKRIYTLITQQKLQEINSTDTEQNISLLESFRRGCFHKYLESCSMAELKQLLPVVAMSLCQLPFGLTEFRSNLFIILANRISTDASLDQSWRFFLNCNRDIPEIIRTWESHEYLKQEKEIDTDEYKGKDATDSVLFFRSLFKTLSKTGSRKSVDRHEFICDPINGNILIEVQLNKIMPSNARPYLVDCYTFDATSGQPLLSSRMLLKKGDDLRKDLGVMLMFKFMNELWRENDIRYNAQRCETLVYNVIPMALDFGAIEFIQGATKIAHIEDVMKHDDLNIDRLIATAAASYVASYVCGVRDRHHDNILVCNDGTLFHIDFSHILGEKLKSLDAAKIAIPTKFVKVLGNKNWNKFLDVVVLCFQVLRNNYVYLSDYSRIVFAFMKRTQENDRYLKESLLVDSNEKDALQKIKGLFNKAPSQIKTKMKNVIHSFAVKAK